MKKIVLVSGLMAVLLAGCGNHDQQQAQVIQPQPQQVAQGQVIQQDPQPQVVQQAPMVQQAPVMVQQPPVIIQQAPTVVHDNSGATLAAGMAIGMMAAGPGRTEVVHHYHNAPAPAPVIVNKTYVNKTVVQAAPQPQVVVNKTTIVNTRPPVMRPSYAATSSNSSYKSVRTVTTTTRR